MKKTTTTLGVFLAAALIYTGTSWYVGKQAQTVIANTIDQANQRIAKLLDDSDKENTPFRIEIRDYQRGVFSSRSQYVIHTLDAQGKPLDYIMQDHMQHGPFPWDLLRAGKFKPMLAYSQADMVVTPTVGQWFGQNQEAAPLHVATQIGFGGAGVSDWKIAPLDISRGDRHVQFSGGQGHVKFSNDFSDNTVQARFADYSMAGEAGAKLTLQDIRLDSTSQTLAKDQIDQQGKLQVASMMVVEGAGQTEPLQLDGVSVSFESTQRGHMLDLVVDYGSERVMSGAAPLGQMLAGLELKQLDIQALLNLQLASDEITTGEDDWRVLMPQIRAVLAGKPSIQLGPVVWKNTSGQSEATVSMILRDPGRDADSDFDEEWLRAMFDRVDVETTLSRPMAVQLFQDVGAADGVTSEEAGELGGQLFDEYAKVFEGAGLMIRADQALRGELMIKPAEDHVELNGQVMTIEELLRVGFLLLFALP